MYNASNTSPNSSTAVSVQDLFNVWVNALTKPNVPTYQQEATRGSQNSIILNLGVGIAAVVVLTILRGLLENSLVFLLVSVTLSTVIGFAINVAGLYLGAKISNGTGTLEQQAWVQSTYAVPLMILGALPFVGWLFGIVALFYQIYLTYITAQAVHRLPSDKALIATLVWAAVYIVVGAIITFVLLALLAIVGLAAAAATTR